MQVKEGIESYECYLLYEIWEYSIKNESVVL